MLSLSPPGFARADDDQDRDRDDRQEDRSARQLESGAHACRSRLGFPT